MGASPLYLAERLGGRCRAGVINLGLVCRFNREEQLAKLELGTRANTYALTLQFGIASFTRKVAGLRALFDSTTNVSRA